MTYPDPDSEDTSALGSPATDVPNPDTNSNDVPLASVNTFGPSELLTYITVLGGLATSLFGHDWGISKNAQALAVLVAGLVTASHSLARAWKHHSVTQANAVVIAAQVTATGASIANVVNNAAPRKRAPRKAVGDAGAAILGVIGLVLAVIGALLLIIVALQDHALSVTGLILLVVGGFLYYLDNGTGSRRVL